jgi:hypothetical protein
LHFEKWLSHSAPQLLQHEPKSKKMGSVFKCEAGYCGFVVGAGRGADPFNTVLIKDGAHLATNPSVLTYEKNLHYRLVCGEQLSV